MSPPVPPGIYIYKECIQYHGHLYNYLDLTALQQPSCEVYFAVFEGGSFTEALLTHTDANIHNCHRSQVRFFYLAGQLGSVFKGYQINNPAIDRHQ